VTEAVVLATARTPIGRANKGSLVDVDAFDLAEVVIAAAIARSGVPADDLDDLVMAESLQGGGVIGRHVAVRLGLVDLPGMADNRHCAAGLSAVQIAAGGIRAGMDRVVVAGGTESLSSMPQVLKSIPASARDYQPWMSPSHPSTDVAPAFDMSITVGENTARLAGLTRDDVDRWAYESHQRAGRAVAEGWFEDQICPVEVPDGAGTRTFAVDEHPRPGTTLDGFAALPALHPELPDATVTAGNAAGLNDAAAAVVVASDDYAAGAGIAPLARIVSWASVGVDPVRTGLAPTIAIPKALERAGMAITDVDVFEINEAFCAVPVAAVRALDLDPELVNPYGSGCSLGHPIAATGARMVVTMIDELRRRDASVAVVAMCAGGGMGSALVLERLR
jgi:acetyl-CoA acetyltransferase family protein